MEVESLDLINDLEMIKFGTHPSQITLKKVRTDLETNVVSPITFLTAFVTTAEPQKPIQFCALVDLAERAVHCLSTSKSFSETDNNIIVNTTYRLLSSLVNSVEELLVLKETEETRGYITRAILSCIHILSQTFNSTNIFLSLVIAKLRDSGTGVGQWDGILERFQHLYDAILESGKTEVQMESHEKLWGTVRLVECAPSTSVIYLSFGPEISPSFWLKKLRVTEGQMPTLFLRLYLQKQIFGNDICSLQEIEFILELFLQQRAFRVQEFLLLIWVTSFQLCLEKGLTPSELRLAYSFIFSKIPKIMKIMISRNSSKRRFGEKKDNANEVEASLAAVSNFFLLCSKEVHSGLNLLQLAILSCTTVITENGAPLVRLDVLSQLGKTLEKECQLVRTILSPKFQSERYLNIELIDTMFTKIFNHPLELAKIIIDQMISGLGDQVHVEEYLSETIFKILDPKLNSPREVVLQIVSSLNQSRGAAIIFSNHVGLQKLLALLVTRCSSLSAISDYSEFEALFNFIYYLSELFQLRDGRNPHVLSELKKLLNNEDTKGKSWFWLWLYSELSPEIGQNLINRVFGSTNAKDAMGLGKDLRAVDILISLPFFLKQSIAAIQLQGTPSTQQAQGQGMQGMQGLIVNGFSALMHSFPFTFLDLFLFLLKEAISVVSADTPIYINLLEELSPAFFSLLKNSNRREVAKLSCLNHIKLLMPQTTQSLSKLCAQFIEVIEVGEKEGMAHRALPSPGTQLPPTITLMTHIHSNSSNNFLTLIRSAFVNPMSINPYHIQKAFESLGPSQFVRCVVQNFLSSNNSKINPAILTTELISSSQVAAYLISEGGIEALISLCSIGLEEVIPSIETPTLGHAVADMFSTSFSFLGIGEDLIDSLPPNTKERLVFALKHAFKTIADVFQDSLVLSFSMQVAPQAILALPLSIIQMLGSVKHGVIHSYGPAKKFARSILFLHQKTENLDSASNTATGNGANPGGSRGRRKFGFSAVVANSLLVKCFDLRRAAGQEECLEFLANTHPFF